MNAFDPMITYRSAEEVRMAEKRSPVNGIKAYAFFIGYMYYFFKDV